MATTDQILSWRGRELYDRDGEKIGTIDEVYLDTTTNQPEWALVNTGLFGLKSTFVPLRDAETSGDEVRVAHTKSHVKDAPGIDPDGRLSESEEAELHRHYDLDRPADDGSDSGLADGRTTRDVELLGDDDDEAHRDSGDAMTRSEEELSVGTSARETGRARLRKYVETEDVTEERDVSDQVRRERIEIEGDARDD